MIELKCAANIKHLNICPWLPVRVCSLFLEVTVEVKTIPIVVNCTVKFHTHKLKGGYSLLNAKAQKSALDHAVVFQDELRLSIHNTTLRQCFTTHFNRGFNESFHRFG